MIVPIALSLEEKEILHLWRKQAPNMLVRDRAHEVLMNSSGWAAYRIAPLIFRPEKKVRSWLQEYREKRISSVLPGYQGNTNASKLTTEQRDQIHQILQQSPSEHGLPREFWTLTDMKNGHALSLGWCMNQIGHTTFCSTQADSVGNFQTSLM